MSPRTFAMAGLNRLAQCPASGVESEGQADASGHGAVVGIAYHQVMAHAATHGVESGHDAVKEICVAHGLEPEEVHPLLTKFPFDPSGGEPEVYLTIEYPEFDILVQGRSDLVITHSEKHHEVVDYKTTHDPAAEPEPDQHPQLLAYGLGVWRRAGWADDDSEATVTVALAYPRLGDSGWAQHDMNHLEKRYAESVVRSIVVEAAEQWEREVGRRRYRTGGWCQWCPGRATCPALATDIRGALNVLDQGVEITRENVVPLYGLRQAMTKFTSAIKGKVEELIDPELGGPIVFSDGERVLEKRQSDRRPAISNQAIDEAMMRCGVDQVTRRSVLSTLDMRPRKPSSRLGIFKVRDQIL